MHILIVTPEYPPHVGGISAFYGTQAPLYAKAGHHVTVLVANPFSDDFASYQREGVAVCCVPRAAVCGRAERMGHLSAVPLVRSWLGASAAVAEAVPSFEPDVIESADFGLLFASLLTRTPRPPVLVQMHGSIGQISTWEPARPRDALDVALSRLLELSLLPAVDEIQALSPRNADEWCHRLGRSCALIPPAFQMPETARGQDDASALVVARIQPWKGPALLCEALAQSGLTTGSPTVDWVGRDTATAPGGGSLDAYLGATYPSLWRRMIRPAGVVPPERVRAMQGRARFVIVPSLWDTFNLTVAEAMAAQRVVICSDAVGASFLIEDGVNGLLFKAGDAGALAGALRRALRQAPSEASEMGAAAARTIARELDPNRVARHRLERMERLVSRAASPAPVPDWLAAFVSDAGASPVTPDFLANTSIRDLTSHLAGRLRQRVLPTSAGPGRFRH